MKAVIQRVQDATVSVEGTITGQIDHGLLVYLGIGHDDTEQQLTWLCEKIVKLRVFTDEQGKMNRSLADVSGSILVVSQFTLLANLRKGNRPSYNDAAPPQKAEALYEQSLKQFAQLGFPVASGQFGAHMKVSYTNDGPVTLLLEAE
ncbi:MAG: D-aminoacyl-tRNA deacylase [Sphaerochaeta sp.]|jgi:D-tyrosyl-tRNA(Tyr) deacylase|uniref:D-aminoacyl-tRNA deacylase n=1 Tax=Sphaerochaeta halotolerans TaxID=2293840 RepID=A0A372MFV4_9SPIR|nr:D-aminoacyl-tRNA deacylase [Sphaerochaeta halotolerans]MDK2860263.1 D-aminoacyl-tRNA deacylase [Sphaerochaeta sp.]RFU94624.1 D-tyrosyl-tRNA(Tyr) deacylase [Sphaerochaeta halotolerans]